MKLKSVKQGILKFEFTKKNGLPADLNEGEILDSKDIKKDLFDNSYEKGQIKLYMDAGWIIKADKEKKEEKKEVKKEVKKETKKVKPKTNKKETKTKRGGKKK